MYIFTIFIFFATVFSYSGCNEIDEYLSGDTTGPTITVNDELLSFEGLNEGDMIEIPVKITSKYGIKRLAYFYKNETPNGLVADDPIYIDKEDTPTEISETIRLPLTYNAKELVIISFDKRNRSSEIHVRFEATKTSPKIVFKNNVKYRASVFENKNFVISGNINSDYNLTSTVFSTIIDDVVSAPKNLTIDGNNFSATVFVTKGLSGIIIRVENENNAVVVDTFKIGEVVDDAVNITMKDGITSLQNFGAGEVNTYEGNIISGSNISKFVYQIKKNGNWGNEINIPIGDPADEFNFTLAIMGESGMESVKLYAENTNGKTSTIELIIPEVINKVLYFKDVKLTTAIGPGLHNWFSYYLEPHVFDQVTAREHQDMLDFVCALYDNSQMSLLSGHIFNASTLYNQALTPYLEGFSTVNFCLLSGNRNEITFESFDAIKTEEDLNNFIANQ
ncbi:MAG: hypothetical protein PHQ11_02235 [Paludibacter sp.]|nr:hypothetical protein [Paludibacter sp.]